MSIGNAMKFISLVDSDSTFRKSLYKVKGPQGLTAFLEEKDLTYTAGEFEEAVSHLHAQCQLAEDADKLFNTVNLTKLIVNSTK